jgi:hypothetical protein
MHLVTDKGKNKCFLGFEVVTPVIAKNSLFWNVMPCNLFKVSGHLEEYISFSGSKNKPSKEPA